MQALGTGITLDSPLARGHAINAVVRDAAVTTAGYQGAKAPNQWFGGPALSTSAGNMVLRDAAGHVADSLNYGLLVDPWSAEGYQAGSPGSGCKAAVPASTGTLGRSVARFPDGADTDSNCTDFRSSNGTFTDPTPGTGELRHDGRGPGERRRRRHGAGDAVAVARHAGGVRGVHAGRREDLRRARRRRT